MKGLAKNNRRASAAELVNNRASKPNATANDERIFVIAPIGGDANAIATLLAERGWQASVCDDPATGAIEVTNAGALVMTEEALQSATGTNLLTALEHQPAWSELPVIILTSGGASRLTRLFDLAAAACGGVTLLERPISTETLLRTIDVALRSRRRQYQVRDLIAEQERNRASLEENEEKLRLMLAQEQGLRQEADDANRLKDEFLATMSHELRNPLNVILGYSELLLRTDEIKASAQLFRLSEALRRNALAQSHLIRDLLELSRLRSGKLTLNCETISLMTAVNEAFETVRSDAQAKQIEIEISAPPEPLFVEGDLLRLEQVVWNLLANAVKFTPAGGKVSVSVDRKDDQVVLIVDDSGQGIDAAFLPSVFEMFRQGDARANREHSGMGIGLALVQQLVQLHGGSVVAQSEGRGRGTKFTVSFPEKPESTKGAALQPVIAFESLNELAVLAVDDDEDTTALLRYLLEMNGAKVTTANSGRDALKLARELTFDVVLSDISMPSMDGFEFVRRLRSLPGKENVPVVALTGYGRKEDVEQAANEGFVAHLTKPFDVGRLLAFLSQLSPGNDRVEGNFDNSNSPGNIAGL
jgi:signal transduction histidine kinase/ActR/RegA family two-component response regulator